MRVPNVTFKTRIRDEVVEGPNPFRWEDVTSEEIFGGKRVVLFALPGAFTPTCSTTHLPRFEAFYDEFRALGIDEVYCLSVNDAFVMYQWGKSLGVEKVKLLPDGSAAFTRGMNMLVKKDNLGFGLRSWARRFLYYQLFRASLPFENYLEEHGPWPGFVWLKRFNWRELLPENSPTMQAILDGVLHHGDFLLPEN